jgi:hypothetical protein
MPSPSCLSRHSLLSSKASPSTIALVQVEATEDDECGMPTRERFHLRPATAGQAAPTSARSCRQCLSRRSSVFGAKEDPQDCAPITLATLAGRPGQSSESRISLNDSHDVAALVVSEDPYDYDSDEIPLPPLRVSMLAYGSLQTRRPTPLFRSASGSVLGITYFAQ